MSGFHIAEDWLEASRDTAFFYPCAGSDHVEPLSIFRNYIDRFCFCDLNYPIGLDLLTAYSSNSNAEFRLVGREILGAPLAEIETRFAENNRSYRFLPPSQLVETYEGIDGRKLTVVRRRGFGQIGLSKDSSDRSLGVFMHRGDSPGESGSNIYFLANKKRRYEPCSNLFEKLGRRLRDRAIIISDGSNSSIRQLRRFHNTSTEGPEAFSYHQGRSFAFGGFLWTCAGWLSRRYGPTLLWGLTRQPSPLFCPVGT